MKPFNVLAIQNMPSQSQSSSILMGGRTFGMPSSSPILTSQTDSINAVNAPNIIQDSSLSDITFSRLQASVLQGGTIIGTNITIASGTIGGWIINGNTLTSPNGNIVLDSSNNRIILRNNGVNQIDIQG